MTNPRNPKDELAKDMQAAFLSGSGEKALKVMIFEAGIFIPDTKPDQIAARNAGMRMLNNITGGDGEVLADALIEGLKAKFG